MVGSETNLVVKRLESSISGCGRSKGEPMTRVAVCSPSQLFFRDAIPTYNRSSSVKSLLKSICKQIGGDDEVIVSDDGSTDGTVEKVSMPN
jgi:hypothetical protein